MSHGRPSDSRASIRARVRSSRSRASARSSSEKEPERIRRWRRSRSGRRPARASSAASLRPSQTRRNTARTEGARIAVVDALPLRPVDRSHELPRQPPQPIEVEPVSIPKMVKAPRQAGPPCLRAPAARSSDTRRRTAACSAASRRGAIGDGLVALDGLRRNHVPRREPLERSAGARCGPAVKAALSLRLEVAIRSFFGRPKPMDPGACVGAEAAPAARARRGAACGPTTIERLLSEVRIAAAQAACRSSPRSTPLASVAFRADRRPCHGCPARFALGRWRPEEMPLTRGIVVSRETVRRWGAKLRAALAREPPRRAPPTGHARHPGEVRIGVRRRRHAADRGGVASGWIRQPRRARHPPPSPRSARRSLAPRPRRSAPALGRCDIGRKPAGPQPPARRRSGAPAIAARASGPAPGMPNPLAVRDRTHPTRACACAEIVIPVDPPPPSAPGCTRSDDGMIR